MADPRYQNQFRDFNVQPSSGVWEGVREQLDRRNQQLQRQAYGLSGVVLLLLTGFFLGLLYQDRVSNTANGSYVNPQNFVVADSLLQRESPAYFYGSKDSRKHLSNKRPSFKKHPVSRASMAKRKQPVSEIPDETNVQPARDSNGPFTPGTKSLSHAVELEKQPRINTTISLPEAKVDQPTAEMMDVSAIPKVTAGEQSSWSLGLRTGMVRSFSNYQVKAPYNKGIKDQVKASHGKAWMYNATLRTQYHLGHHWHVISGLGIEQVRRSFHYRPTAAFKWNPGPNGDNENEGVLAGDDAAFIPEEKTTTNTTNYLRIPLRLQYSFGFNRWRFGLEAGVTVRRILQASGKATNPLTQRVRDRSAGNTALQEWQANLVIQPDIAYQIAPSWQVSLAPMAGIAIDSRYKSAYPLTNRPRQLGIQTGIQYDF